MTASKMSSRIGFVFCVTCSAIAGCGSSGSATHSVSQEDMVTMDPLPLAPGAKWTYDVTVKRYDPDADKESTKTLTWTTEVVDARVGNGVTAYRIKGWPTDLADFDLKSASGPVATERTLLRAGNNFLWAADAVNGAPDLDGAEGWFTWPVTAGQKICPSATTVYCWQVSAAPAGYALSFYTGPDEQSFELEPGTGVSRFHYAHHGTTNEVEAKLVNFTHGR
jgi:hypothetical protein